MARQQMGWTRRDSKTLSRTLGQPETGQRSVQKPKAGETLSENK